MDVTLKLRDTNESYYGVPSPRKNFSRWPYTLMSLKLMCVPPELPDGLILKGGRAKDTLFEAHEVWWLLGNKNLPVQYQFPRLLKHRNHCFLQRETQAEALQIEKGQEQRCEVLKVQTKKQTKKCFCWQENTQINEEVPSAWESQQQ